MQHIILCCALGLTPIVSSHSLNAQEENLARQDVSRGERYIDKLRDFLTVEFTPDSVVQYDGWSTVALDTISSPYGTGVVMGNNDQDAIFLPAESVDGLDDFTISFFVKLNGLNHFNNILGLANDANFNELIIAYNDIRARKGILLTVAHEMRKFPGTEGVLSDLEWHHICIVKADGKATALVDGYVMGSSIEVSDAELHVEPNGFVVGQDQDTVGGGFQGFQSLNGAIADLTIYHYALDIASAYPKAYEQCAAQGTPCDDGDASTLDDREDGQCNCQGTPEVKEQELALTKAVSETRARKNRLLLFGLIGLALFSLALFYIITLRRRLERAKLEMRNLEERQKREQAEKNLAVKQKELTAKVLQLASKNEFLANLESEMRQLQSIEDVDLNVASKRISRMIEFDAVDEEMWDQFSKEFMVLHSDFMNQLVQEFGSFTKTEMRLISLMKMNLSSKDIAGILRISDTGLKKARYRLRKKLGLDSKVNLQSYLLTYKS